MRSLYLALVAAVAIAVGCQWTPDRDNPFDPQSPLYSAPPQSNRPPQIDAFFMTTNCRATYFGGVCDFSLTCIASDSDFNLNPSNVAVFLDNNFFDFMNYNSSRDEYFLNRSERDLPNGSIDDYVNHPIRVIVSDDSNASDTATFIVVSPFRGYPTIRHPEGYLDIVENRDTIFAWDQWNGIQISGFDVSFKYLNDIVVSDLAFHDISPTDTSLTIHYPFRPSNGGRELYAWYVTATDVAGNKATSFPGTFFYFEQQ